MAETRASLVAQTVKHPTAVQETWVQSLGREDPLEKDMATHSSLLTWKISWTKEIDGLYSPWGHKELDMTEQLTHRTQYSACHSLAHWINARNWASLVVQ